MTHAPPLLHHAGVAAGSVARHAIAPRTPLKASRTRGLVLRRCCAGGGGPCACEDARRKRLERRAASSDALAGAVAPAAVHDVLRSPGRPLDAAVRRTMETRFAHDFGRVRIHTDARAADSARAVNAEAYAVGSHLVFASGRYAPGGEQGRRLLAHELTHALQSPDSSVPPRGSLRIGDPDAPAEREAAEMARTTRARVPAAASGKRSPIVSRQVNRQTVAEPVPCDASQEVEINAAIRLAQTWRRGALRWIDRHRELGRARGNASARRGGTFVRLGPPLFEQLRFLDAHFRIRDTVRAARGLFPYDANDSFDAEGIVTLIRGSSEVLRRYGNVAVDLPHDCGPECPRGRSGADTRGSAEPGSRRFTLYYPCWARLSREERAGVVLHEAFHASFPEFNHDTYSFERGYPGARAQTNADSFATFASTLALGTSHRDVLPEIEIRGRAGGDETEGRVEPRSREGERE